jgi:drug/metabolite transporter (DMT)-like permease
MSVKSKRYYSSYTDRINGSRLVSVNNDEAGEEVGCPGDEDSMTELGQIALLSSSRASLRYKSLNDLNLTRKNSGISRRSRSSRDARSSRLLINKQSITDDEISKGLPDDLKETLEDDVYLDEPLTCFEKLSLMLLPYKGYIFGILSAFSFSASQVTIKRAKWLGGSDHSLVRYIVTFIVMFTVLKYKNLSIFGPRRLLKILLFRGFVGSCALICLYFAIMLINPSDAITIAHTSIVITAVLARIFLKEKITLAHFIALILTIIGVLFICKPSFLFSMINPKYLKKATHVLNATNCTLLSTTTISTSTILTNLVVPNMHNDTLRNSLEVVNINCSSQNEEDLKDLKTIIGISLTFIGAFASSCVYLVLKKLSNSKVHWASNTIYVCWFGTPFSIMISLFLISQNLMHKNFEQEKKDLPLDFFYSIIGSCLSITGQIFLNISLKYEDATKITIVKTIGN